MSYTNKLACLAMLLGGGGAACSNKNSGFVSKDSGLSDTKVQADISKASELSNSSQDAQGAATPSGQPGANSESQIPPVGNSGSPTEALPPSSSGSSTMVVSNSEPLSNGPGNSQKKQSPGEDSESKETLPSYTNGEISGASGFSHSEIGLEKSSYRKKLEESFKPDSESFGSCAPYFKNKLLDAKISGSMNTISTDGKNSMAFKVTGNKNSLNINYKNQGSNEVKTTFEGLCIFAAGNQSKVVVSIKDVLLKRIVAVARGRNVKIEIKVEGTGDVSEIVFDGKGNSPELEVLAPATFPCKDRLKNVYKEAGECKVIPQWH